MCFSEQIFYSKQSLGAPVHFSSHMADSVVREIQKTKRSVIVLRSQFSLVYLCVQFVFSAAALHFLKQTFAATNVLMP